MAAQTFTIPRTAPIPGNPGAGAGVVHSQYRTYTIPETPEVGDIYELFMLPKGAVPIGGYLSAQDIDTNATETFDMDVGIAANGVDAADPDFFTNAGVLIGDNAATEGVLTNAAQVRWFVGGFPVAQLGANTVVQAVVNAVAATFAASTKFTVRVDYLMPGVSSS